MDRTQEPETTKTLPLDEVELPSEVEEWLAQLAGRFHISFPFDADTYFDRERDLYDRDE